MPVDNNVIFLGQYVLGATPQAILWIGSDGKLGNNFNLRYDDNIDFLYGQNAQFAGDFQIDGQLLVQQTVQFNGDATFNGFIQAQLGIRIYDNDILDYHEITAGGGTTQINSPFSVYDGDGVITPTFTVISQNGSLTNPIVQFNNTGVFGAAIFTVLQDGTLKFCKEPDSGSPNVHEFGPYSGFINSTQVGIGTNLPRIKWNATGLGFFSASAVAQPGATVDLGTVLSNLGLRVSGTAYPITTSGAVAFSGGLTLTGANLTLTDRNIVLGTTTGTQVGTATTQKLAFFGSTPIVQVGATIDLGVVLSNLGLRAAGTAYPITTSGAVTFSGGLTITTTNLTITDKDVVLSATTGTKIGTAITQKLGFYNATPIVQRSGAAQTAVAVTTSTNVTPFGYTTQAQADAIVTLVNELRAWAVVQGFIKGSA